MACPLLSHTRQVGAALLCHCDEADSVGIDIEYSHRLVSNKAVRYFKNALDDWNYNTSEGILWAWSLKEAAFKALSPIKEKRLLLKDIWIDEKKFGLDSAPLGIFKRQFNSSLSLHIALALYWLKYYSRKIRYRMTLINTGLSNP